MKSEIMILSKADYSVGHSRLEKHGKSLLMAYADGVVMFTVAAKSVADQSGKSTICAVYEGNHVGQNIKMPP